MGTSLSLQAAADKVRAVGVVVDGKAKRSGLNEIGKEAKDEMHKAVVRDLGPDRMMRNKKVPVSAGYELGDDHVAIEPRGGQVIWRWITQGVGPHVITPFSKAQGGLNLVAALAGGRARRVKRSRQTRSKTNEAAFQAARSGIIGAIYAKGYEHPIRFVRHPGMKPMDTWDEGVRRIKRITPGKVMDKAIAAEIGKVL